MIPSISPSLSLQRLSTTPTATTLPKPPPLPWDHYAWSALALASTIVVVLLYLISTSPPSAPAGYSRLDAADAESPLSDEHQAEREVDGYPFELRKALGTPVDAAAYEARRLGLHIAIALLAVLGLAVDATSIVSIVSGAKAVPTKIYFSATCAALRTLVVSLAMLELNLSEPTRLAFIVLLSAFYLVAQLLLFLTDYKHGLSGLGGDSNVVLHTLNLGCSAIIFLLAFLSPSGPTIRVEGTPSLPARNVVRNSLGGGSVAQELWGFLALPVVRQAYTTSRIDANDIPALDYTYRSAVVAEQVIREYRRSLSLSLAKHPEKRSDSVKARALLRALVRCNAAQLVASSIMLVIVTLAFYVPKFGLGILLDGIEKYEASIQGADDTVAKRARSTLIYSAIFYLTLFGENFLVYLYFRPLSVYLKAKVQTQLTTLLAWKRLRQKEASGSTAEQQDVPEDAQEQGPRRKRRLGIIELASDQSSHH